MWVKVLKYNQINFHKSNYVLIWIALYLINTYSSVDTGTNAVTQPAFPPRSIDSLWNARSNACAVYTEALGAEKEGVQPGRR